MSAVLRFSSRRALSPWRDRPKDQLPGPRDFILKEGRHAGPVTVLLGVEVDSARHLYITIGQTGCRSNTLLVKCKCPMLVSN
jgi:hypothetical protein